ncbi:MAG: DUF421 domain-containing protein [Actinomycetota bacterium]|nr:DUF421 domain-containing protein [Actinomycetota bacterium]
MSAWFVGSLPTVAFVAASTVLIYCSTIVVLRLDERRTLAQMSPFDFVVAVALGAIVARTATSPQPTYLQGLVAVVALLATHRLLGVCRARWEGVRRVLEKPPIVLVSRGAIHSASLRDAHLVESDVISMLRGQGVVRLEDVDLAMLEANGTLSVLCGGEHGVDDALLTGVRWPEGRGDER